MKLFGNLGLENYFTVSKGCNFDGFRLLNMAPNMAPLLKFAMFIVVMFITASVMCPIYHVSHLPPFIPVCHTLSHVCHTLSHLARSPLPSVML